MYDDRDNRIYFPDEIRDEFPWRPKHLEFDGGTRPSARILQLIGAMSQESAKLSHTARERVGNACREIVRSLMARDLSL